MQTPEQPVLQVPSTTTHTISALPSTRSLRKPPYRRRWLSNVSRTLLLRCWFPLLIYWNQQPVPEPNFSAEQVSADTLLQGPGVSKPYAYGLLHSWAVLSMIAAELEGRARVFGVNRKIMCREDTFETNRS